MARVPLDGAAERLSRCQARILPCSLPHVPRQTFHPLSYHRKFPPAAERRRIESATETLRAHAHFK
eukprot:5699619-Pyramimonas_sp.AAC.1